MSIGCSSKQADRQNRKGSYPRRNPGHFSSFPRNSNRGVGLQGFSRPGHQASPVGNRVNNPDSHSHNIEALNNSSIAGRVDIREPRHEGREGHDDRHGARHDYRNHTGGHVRARQTSEELFFRSWSISVRFVSLTRTSATGSLTFSSKVENLSGLI